MNLGPGEGARVSLRLTPLAPPPPAPPTLHAPRMPRTPHVLAGRARRAARYLSKRAGRRFVTSDAADRQTDLPLHSSHRNHGLSTKQQNDLLLQTKPVTHPLTDTLVHVILLLLTSPVQPLLLIHSSS